MRIVISKHAVERFKERWPCSPGKYQKLAEKAWRSTEKVDKGDVASPQLYPNSVAKKLMGRIFVFEEKEDDVILLVTLYASVKHRARDKAQHFAWVRKAIKHQGQKNYVEPSSV